MTITGRSSLAGPAETLADALTGLAGTATVEIDMTAWDGMHPAIGALDVCPVVWLSERRRQMASEVALEVGRRSGRWAFRSSLRRPASDADRRERAYFRAGGPIPLWQRMTSRALRPTLARTSRTHGRGDPGHSPAPIAAFNLELATDDLAVAREIAAAVGRDRMTVSRGSAPSACCFPTGRAQVSTNVHDPIETPWPRSSMRFRKRRRWGTYVVEAELIGLIPEAALERNIRKVPIRDFDPAFHVIERRLKPRDQAGQ